MPPDDVHTSRIFGYLSTEPSMKWTPKPPSLKSKVYLVVFILMTSSVLADFMDQDAIIAGVCNACKVILKL